MDLGEKPMYICIKQLHLPDSYAHSHTEKSEADPVVPWD